MEKTRKTMVLMRKQNRRRGEGGKQRRGTERERTLREQRTSRSPGLEVSW